MTIGEPQRIITIEPIEEPAVAPFTEPPARERTPEPERIPEPERVPEPVRP